MADHNYFANLIWQIADLLRRPVPAPAVRARHAAHGGATRFDCVLASSKVNVLAEHDRRKGGRVEGETLDPRLNKATECHRRWIPWHFTVGSS